MKLIAEGNFDQIAKIPYVGLRTARQIIFDFQKKYNLMLNKEGQSKNKLEVFQTLKSLGFNKNQIDLVANKLEDTNDIEKMVEKAGNCVVCNLYGSDFRSSIPGGIFIVRRLFKGTVWN